MSLKKLGSVSKHMIYDTGGNGIGCDCGEGNYKVYFDKKQVKMEENVMMIK